MSVRQSSRQTKGVNPRIDHMDSPSDMGGKKGTARKVTKKKAAEEEEEEEIRCVCGADSTDDDSGEAWIACDECGVWQHNVCVGVSTFEDEIPEHYLCEQHDEVFHKDLLKAMKEGRHIWEDRKKEWQRREAQEALAKKKGKKGGGRKSDIGTNGKANTPLPDSKKSTPAKASKRKDRHESVEKDAVKEPKPKIRKVTPLPPVQHQKTPPSDTPVRIIDLDQKRQGPATLIHKALQRTIPIAISAGLFNLLGDDTVDTKAERLAIQVEEAVLESHPESAYIKQCRAIGANLKQNQELSNSLLAKTITPLALAGMSSDDMATSELKQETAAMKARADKQSILLTEEGPRIRRTHKGDEIIEGDDQTVANDSTMAISRRRSMLDPNADMATRSRENSPGVELPDMGEYRSRDDIRGHVIPKQPLNIETKAPPVRKPSQADFDINKVFSSVQSPTGPHTPHAHIRRPSGPAPPTSGPGNDPEIDKLLQDDDGLESPPYSPSEYPSDPDVVWRGAVIMDSIARFTGSAKHVAGGNTSIKAAHNPNPIPWSDCLQKDLRIAGRIDELKANEYLCSLRYSPPTDVVVVQVTPTVGEETANEFKLMYDYFQTKDRYGVLTNNGISNIRDTYLVPVAPSPAPLPDFLRNLQIQNLPENRSEPILLVVLVIRQESAWQLDPRSFDGISADAHSPSIPLNPHFQHPSVSAVPSGFGPSMSPIVPQNGNFGGPQSALPPQQQNPAQSDQVRQLQLDQDQIQGEATARRILGIRVNDPTVGFLMPNAARMRPLEWEVIKDILESDERSRTDLLHLSARLEREIQEHESMPPR